MSKIIFAISLISFSTAGAKTRDDFYRSEPNQVIQDITNQRQSIKEVVEKAKEKNKESQRTPANTEENSTSTLKQ